MLLRAASTPRGKPIVTAITTATTISAIVSIVFSHRSMKPTNSRANMVNPISLQRPTAKERNATATTTAGQGTHFNMSSIATNAWATALLIPSNSQLPFSVTQSTASSIAPPIASRTVLSRTRVPPLSVSTSVRETVVGNSISGPQNPKDASNTTITSANPTSQNVLGSVAALLPGD